MMESPAHPPQQQATLNKVPFIIADVVFILVAIGIASHAVYRNEPLSAWSVAGCLGFLFLGFLFIVAPFVIEFALQLQAKNEELEEALHDQSAVLEDALGRWNRLHSDVKAIFDSSKINVAGYEGLLHRFDQRMETLDTRLKEIESVGRVGTVFETGLKEMSERAETLHSQEAEGWEKRLAEHHTQVEAALGKLRQELLEKIEQAPTAPAEATISEEALEPLQASLDAILGQLESFERAQEPTDTEEAEEWSDPKGKYGSMLERALGENKTKASFPIPASAEEEATEPDEIVEELEEDTVDIEELPEEEPVAEDEPQIDPAAMPILDDDFIDEIPEEFEEETPAEEEPSAVEDVDWPEPDEAEEAEAEEPGEVEELPKEETEPELETEELTSEEPAETTPVITEQPAEAASITTSILIGIGDKIFVRGNGHGLQPDIGTEMEFVNIGSYRWSHDGITTPLTLEFYLNDEIASVEGPITLKPGEHIEVSPDFP